MDSRLLVTKFHVPRPRFGSVSRIRLLEQIDEGLRRNHRLILIAAPAGYGKTALVTEWIEQRQQTVVWLSLDEADNDPVYFFNLLIAALQRIKPEIGETAAQLLHLPQPAFQSVCASLINDLAAVNLELTLVFDDYHVIDEPVIHQAIQLLLERLPPTIPTLLITRENPPLPLARLRVRNQITEIRAADLRFTRAETTQFFEQTVQLPLSESAIEKLETKTEGWIGGLQLAALALRGAGQDAESFVAQFAGSNRYVADYLIADVLDQQPIDLRDFLRQTSILDPLNGEICNHLTERDDSEIVLRHLETANAFLVPMDYQREWYRYNRMFAEFLRSTLHATEKRRLHLKAAQWYAQNGYLHLAIQHSLTAGAFDEAAQLILQTAESTLHSGRVVTIAHWLNLLPETLVHANAALATYKGWVLLFAGKPGDAENYATAAEAQLPTGDDWGKLQVLRAYLALAQQNYEAVTESASAAVAQFEQQESPWVISALLVLSEAQERTVSIASAIQSLQAARQIGYRMETQIFTAAIDGFLAAALNEHGQRREAVAICEEALAQHTGSSGQPSPVLALIYARLALLEYEANQLDTAQQYYEQFETLQHQLSATELHELAQGIQARIASASGDQQTALAILAGVRKESHSHMADVGWLVADEVNIRLKQGDIAFVAQWAAQWSPDDVPQYLDIDQHLAYARCLMAQNRLDEAERWLTTLESFTQKHTLYRRLLTVYLLQALAAERLSRHPAARERLALAVKLAAPQDYVRAFLDEAPAVLELLLAVRTIAPAFVDTILNHKREQEVDHRAQPLIEPLSERELEVLRLIVAGLSNIEIAQRLFIAEGTVKRHINHIYGKLEVTSRTQAVAKSHELRLWE